MSRQHLQHRPKSFFDTRSQLDVEAKRAVALHICKNMIQPLGSIFMDAGSANSVIAQQMVHMDISRLTVMTNNMRAFDFFKQQAGIRVRLTGGFYTHEDEALLGPGAIFDAENDFCVRWALIGASCITARHVYNHGITGEEQLKKRYWKIPADDLIVPATLRKFGGKDASCFGALCRHIDAVEAAANDVMSIVRHEAMHSRSEYWQTTEGAGESPVPRFQAQRCTIVIEPEWMIQREYTAREREEHLSIVEQINHDSDITQVTVQHAAVSKEDIKRWAPSPHAGRP